MPVIPNLPLLFGTFFSRNSTVSYISLDSSTSFGPFLSSMCGFIS
jgi:hypothetical protein